MNKYEDCAKTFVADVTVRHSSLCADAGVSVDSCYIEVLSIMGALDPHEHKRNQQSLPGSHGEVTGVTGDPDLNLQLIIFFYGFPNWHLLLQVAINSLMRILRDPSLSSYHQKVVGSLMFIFKSMGLACVPYLPKLVLNRCMRLPDDGLVDDCLRAKLSSIWEGFDKGKTFAKPELKSCIEEFEEQLNKLDIDRKEQEITAKNAQSHQQKVESLDNITVTEKEEEEISESEITGAYTLS
ncbi:hypothetical protein MTR67_034589 [Solanum verrucosum]|uniref:Serine/threonine-protein kinase TOR n=1 Tax=Solanum verrucosum TaxID=315347 RepID=A0AAF0U8U0_SOLVR|nr:hypothetical protein MTR67_034589 [Solanum verrucosum]